jgi:hypothetical protein
MAMLGRLRHLWKASPAIRFAGFGSGFSIAFEIVFVIEAEDIIFTL